MNQANQNQTGSIKEIFEKQIANAHQKQPEADPTKVN